MQKREQMDMKSFSLRMMDQLSRWEKWNKKGLEILERVFSDPNILQPEVRKLYDSESAAAGPEPDLSEFQLRGDKLSNLFRWKKKNKREFARLPLPFWKHLFHEIRQGDGKDLRDNLCCKILSGLPRSSAAWEGFLMRYERECELIGRYPWIAKKIGWRKINRMLNVYNVHSDGVPGLKIEDNPTYRLVNARLGLFSRLSKVNRAFLKKGKWLDGALEKYAARVKVKATDILAYACKHGDKIDFELAETDELWEGVYRVDVNVDPETHRCTLTGYHDYMDVNPLEPLYCGLCLFTILGVEFVTPYDELDAWIFSTTGKSIDYGKMTKDEFWGKLTGLIEIDRYAHGCGRYGFDEGAVTDEDLFSKMKCDCDYFFDDLEGNVLAYAEMPEGLEGLPLTREEAFRKLARERPGLTYVPGHFPG